MHKYSTGYSPQRSRSAVTGALFSLVDGTGAVSPAHLRSQADASIGHNRTDLDEVNRLPCYCAINCMSFYTSIRIHTHATLFAAEIPLNMVVSPVFTLFAIDRLAKHAHPCVPPVIGRYCELGQHNRCFLPFRGRILSFEPENTAVLVVDALLFVPCLHV